MDAENQITKEEISMTGFSIVAYSGDARTYLMQAMDKASEGKITEAKELVKKAEESILKVNKEAKFFPVSAKTDEGMEKLASYILEVVTSYKNQ